MKLVFASDSFKGSLSSKRIHEILTETAHEVLGDCEIVSVPMADGGEGTLDAIGSVTGGEMVDCVVRDPLGRPVHAEYLVLPDGTAVVEMAQASGLTLLSAEERNPLKTGTYGTGELILDAIRRGYRKVTVTLGGSATNDGGMGCMRALGVRFLDAEGTELSGCGEDLLRLSRIDVSGLAPEIAGTDFTLMCDVNNPLCGEHGATYTFGPQKGASGETLKLLEQGMNNYRDIIKGEYGTDCDSVPGCGAAGGLGAALLVFLRGHIRSGIDTVLDLTDFDGIIRDADLIITGEGRADEQSARGKVMQGIGLRALKQGIPVIGICGSVEKGADELYDQGISALYATKPPDMPLDEAMLRAEEQYSNTAREVFADLLGSRFSVPPERVSGRTKK